MRPDETPTRPRLASDPPHHERPTVPREDALRAVWKRLDLSRGLRPTLGALVVGGVAVTVAAEIGVAELAVGAFAAYAAYRMLRYGLDLREALVETVQLERAASGALR